MKAPVLALLIPAAMLAACNRADVDDRSDTIETPTSASDSALEPAPLPPPPPVTTSPGTTSSPGTSNTPTGQMPNTGATPGAPEPDSTRSGAGNPGEDRVPAPN